MKILISADMEGITGVTSWAHVDPGPEFGRFRSLMTDDVNAAIRGALAAGATEVVVTDGHSDGTSILLEELDPRASLNTGSPSPFSMMQGIDQGVDGVFCIGYHARQGSPMANLDHTWSSGSVAGLRLNGLPAGEYTLNAALAGHFGVPVIMASGDQTACAQMAEQLGTLELAVVKQATGHFSALCLPPATTERLISAAAERAVRRLREGQAPVPFVVKAPVLVEVDFMRSEMADEASVLPGSGREGICVRYTAADMPTAHRAFRAMVALAESK